MIVFRHRWVHLLCFGLFFTACSVQDDSFPDPDSLPYTFEPVPGSSQYRLGDVYADLDRDGRDEVIHVHPFGDPLGGGHITLVSADGLTIDQVNFPGRVLPPQALDWDGDGMSEIAVPVVHSDSLFLNFVDFRGQKLYRIFLTKGEPRVEEDGAFPWDPSIVGLYSADLEGDGSRELVSLVATGYARQPRGVFVHSLTGGRLIDPLAIGARPSAGYFDDFDGDGSKELVVSTMAPNNGTTAGGFDDRHSYLIAFRLSPFLKVEWSRELGGLWTTTDLLYRDMDGDGDKEIVVLTTSRSSRAVEAGLEILQPGTWQPVLRQTMAEPLASPHIVDLDRDAMAEVVALRRPGEVWEFDRKFRVVQKHQVARELQDVFTLSDIDGDGVDEVVARSAEGSILLGPDLRIKAALAGGALFGMRRRGIGNPADLLVRVGRRVSVVNLVPARFYLLRRYGPAAAWSLGAALFLLILLAVFQLRRRARLLQAVQDLALDTDPRGVLVLQASGQVVMANATARRWLGLDRLAEPSRIRLESALQKRPELDAFLRQALVPPAHRHEANLLLPLEGEERSLRVVVDPLRSSGEGATHWLLCMEDRGWERDVNRSRTWGKMAQRVAHDIKNPLTSVLLTLQRLQMEYRDRVPQVAGDLDSYAARIVERIEHLRGVTRSFMKFVDVEHLRLSETCICSFLAGLSEKVRQNLPPDICLELKVAENLPPVRIDHEQMQTVVENLVTNAVNAMPEGGMVTISADLAPKMSFSTQPEVADYVVIGVLDTGCGIGESEKTRLFDPDFTGSENGTGLGLAIVKKIVEDHGGRVEVESEKGVGAAFRIYLPVVGESSGNGNDAQ